MIRVYTICGEFFWGNFIVNRGELSGKWIKKVKEKEMKVPYPYNPVTFVGGQYHYMLPVDKEAKKQISELKKAYKVVSTYDGEDRRLELPCVDCKHLKLNTIGTLKLLKQYKKYVVL